MHALSNFTVNWRLAYAVGISQCAACSLFSRLAKEPKATPGLLWYGNPGNCDLDSQPRLLRRKNTCFGHVAMPTAGLTGVDGADNTTNLRGQHARTTLVVMAKNGDLQFDSSCMRHIRSFKADS
ncbi:hypothetical protein V2G26_016540 [Clonostachys chloroleuca]